MRYVVSGSVASILYGEPRLTNDVDFVIFLRGTDIARWREMFPSPQFYVPPPEVIAAEPRARPKGVQCDSRRYGIQSGFLQGRLR